MLAASLEKLPTSKTKTIKNQYQMKKQLLFLLAFTMSLTSAYAQIEVTTKDGKQVLLNENGTWEYVKSESDTTEKSAESNDCSTYVSTKTDKVIGKSSTASKETLVISSDGGKTGFGIFMIHISGT